MSLHNRYKVSSKSAIELIREFTTEMMMKHMLHVTGIQFDEQGLERIQYDLHGKVDGTKSIVIAMPCGRVDINKAEERK